LLDALEEEQGQGITIDAARVFFRTALRDYIIIDAPGHIEFLKNMVTGAARAEAAILLIDAKEGVRENSRRHGFLLSMLGIRQVVVAINKIDLVKYSQAAFEKIESEYRAFLAEVGIEPRHVIPISAREGAQIAERSPQLSWFTGPTILEALDQMVKKAPPAGLPLRMPIQDVYKFNERGDDRRIVAGRVETGSVKVGDKVHFSPSGKISTVASVEAWSAPAPAEAVAGMSTGITLTEQIYITRGEIMSLQGESPKVSTKFRANLFWLGRKPMVPGRRYTLKLGTGESYVRLEHIHRVLDASNLNEDAKKPQIERHDVGDVVLRTRNPIAFDLSHELEHTGRFVIVDEYDIAGGGIVREWISDQLQDRQLAKELRELEWVRGDVSIAERSERNVHPPYLIMLSGELGTGKHAIARKLERALWNAGCQAYMLDGKNVYLGASSDIDFDDVDELVRRFGEVANLLLNAGLIVISTTNIIGLGDYKAIATQISPIPILGVHLGPAAAGLPEGSDLRFDPHADPVQCADAILGRLREIWATKR
jgi:bifunctional enzyme CysN/CysC